MQGDTQAPIYVLDPDLPLGDVVILLREHQFKRETCVRDPVGGHIDYVIDYKDRCDGWMGDAQKHKKVLIGDR